MKKIKIDYLSTLFVGIDIGSHTNVISALNFDQDFLIRMVPVANAQGGAVQMKEMIAQALSQHHEFRAVVIGLESTGFYGVHIANYLSISEKLAPFSTKVYCLNPYEVNQCKKSFNSLDKNDGIDSFIIADFARVGHIHTEPWRGAQYLALSGLPDTGSTSRNV
ncbi:IS110 family transposase [Petralouisia muris]|uniref:IS110 family transposase n=1 Tax=Petralouisia muris TaxID=3032872 RepID=UPI0023B7960D|nr:transposase [Petralouisia muris]